MASERMADDAGGDRPDSPPCPPDSCPGPAPRPHDSRPGSSPRPPDNRPDSQPRPPDGRRPEYQPRPLDAIDRDILQMLQMDGRASIRSVAERVHVSRANAYARINRLIDDGVIRGFGARVDHERAGQGASAYVTLKIVQNSWRTVREQLRRLPEASHIALVSGDFDVLLMVHTQDNRALRELVLTKLQSMPEVLSTRTLLVFEEEDLEPDS
ncbi:Lrp/AsnC family transcriptional regulator [Streptomyces antnestii]|uniref:Lrp/AsnC family transcriptional regulator n=1 Tax=Streptomyces antnestii TaxID=2494256 RepID=UPI001CB9A9C5|nr:Lrp/AsnC family transcriptional regulator [Streptomyces sp. San01]